MRVRASLSMFCPTIIFAIRLPGGNVRRATGQKMEVKDCPNMSFPAVKITEPSYTGAGSALKYKSRHPCLQQPLVVANTGRRDGVKVAGG